MTGVYVRLVSLAERVHRRALELLEAELGRRSIADLNATQAMILLQMGQEEMTVGELTLRGCYQGANVSYNLSRLVESGYVRQSRSAHDRRVIRVSASDKGRELLGALEGFYAALERDLFGAAEAELLAACGAGLARIERFSAARLSQATTDQRARTATNVVAISPVQQQVA